MAQRYGGSLEDWEGFGAFSEDPTPYGTHISDQGSISLETQTFLQRAFAGNAYPNTDEISLYANHTNLNQGTIRNWFDGQRATHFGNDGSYRFSDHSDPTNATFLPPAGASSVQQSDLQSISSWIVDKTQSSTDSGFYSSIPDENGSLTQQYLDPQLSEPLFPLHITAEPSLDVFSNQNQPEPLPTVGWSPRSIPSYNLFSPDYSLTTSHQTSGLSIKDDVSPYTAGGHSTTISNAEFLRPYTVSPEIIGSTPSRSKNTSVKSHGDDAVCEQCGKRFTGQYARGNCARHIRRLHAEKPTQLTSDLVCRVCLKGFQRQDARRKHEWRKHCIEESRPVPRRQAAGAAYKASHASTCEAGSDHETVTCTTALPDEPVVEQQYCVPAQAHRAYCCFAEAKEKLDDNAYNFYCRVVLIWCERIVEALRLEQSELYITFAQQTHVLRTQLLSGQYQPTSLNSFTQSYASDTQDAGQDHDGDDVGRQNKGKAPISRRASKASQRSHPYSGRPNKKNAADPLVDALEQFELPEDQELDCPIHKWHGMHGRTSPCNGCGKPYMNGVRQHLLPTYSQQHRAQLPFVQRCDNCKDDFVDAHIWTRGGHWTRRQQGAGTCRARSQPQGSSLVTWARLFLKIYPRETQVPSPYRNDARLLPANFVALLRTDLGLPHVTIANAPQAFPAPPPPPPQGSDRQDDDAAGPQNLHARFQQMEAELAQNATVDILVARASELLAQFLAQEFTETAHERVNIDAIKTFYTNRLNELRQNAWAQLTQTYQATPQPEVEQALLPPAQPNQAQVPVLGGAEDFQRPPYQPDQYVGMVQVPGSDITRSSSHNYQLTDTSLGYPSITTSSRTSYDFANMEQSQQGSTQFYSNVTDHAPSFYPHGQQLSPHDAYLLDQPGSSRLPQQLASNAMMSEIDLMMTSPSESHFALSQTPMETEDDNTFSDENNFSDVD